MSKSRFIRCSAAGAWIALVGLSCATEVSPVDPHASGDGESGSGGAVAGVGGGAAGTGGSVTSTAGSGMAGKSNHNAFGGTASDGGAGSGSAGSGAEGGEMPEAGTSGSSGGATSGAGGAAGSGSGGKAGSGSGGTAGSGAGGSAGSGSAGTSSGNSCAAGWEGDTCDSCSGQTQSDKQACAQILDCYVQHECGPSSCANNDDVCGVNKIGKGTAGYPIAKTVYDCMCK